MAAPGKTIRRLTFCLCLALSAGFPLRAAAQARAATIRPPAVAGKFYPAEPEKLKRAVDLFLRDARPASSGEPLALIAPHAGYIFSGQIAADAYNQARPYDYELIIVLGTNHTLPGFNGVSLFDGAGYRTPLGVAEIDRDLTGRLLAADDDFTTIPEMHADEHSIEVQLPFIQEVFPGRPIVAAIAGMPDSDLCRRFGAALAAELRGRKALIVVSTDLSHYPAYDDAVEADHAALKAIAGLDPARAAQTLKEIPERNIADLSTAACGKPAVLAALYAAAELGATGATVVSYANSGDTALGNPQRVVGYGAVTFHRGASDLSALEAPLAEAADTALTIEHKKWMLAFARETVKRYLMTGTVPLARPASPLLHRRQGAFVTLNKGGSLRGCIGHMAEDSPLCRVIGAMALQAAFNDRRFEPVRVDELTRLEFEISVLTPLRTVDGPEAIVIGRDGAVLQKDQRSAVYLPQVAPEQGWDREEMLEHLCRKAGLDGECWRSGAIFYTFQADVFHEGEFR
jgi:AmmeMemoRadiSam system protein B/AmmeMemoRadiSam system protein A